MTEVLFATEVIETSFNSLMTKFLENLMMNIMLTEIAYWLTIPTNRLLQYLD